MFFIVATTAWVATHGNLLHFVPLNSPEVQSQLPSVREKMRELGVNGPVHAIDASEAEIKQISRTGSIMIGEFPEPQAESARSR